MKVALKKLVEIKSGYSPSTFELLENGSIPYVKVEDMNNCTKYQSESREYCEDIDRSVPAGAIIFPKRGAAIMNNKVRITATDICMDTNMMAIIPNGKIQSEFLYYTITHEKLSRIADTSTIPQINNKHINPYKVALPPLPEQKAIAALLSTRDEAIEKTERLIQAKEKLLKWLLNDLIHVPTKEDMWKQVRMKSLFKERKEGNRGDLPLLSITNSAGVIPHSETNRKDSSNVSIQQSSKRHGSSLIVIPDLIRDLVRPGSCRLDIQCPRPWRSRPAPG
jgi:type I restriction enzyme S subunit